MAKRIRRATGDQLDIVSARAAALALMGDAIYTNLLLLGFAAQRGLVPVGVAALERAIEINGVGVDANKDALRWGRLLAHDPARLDAATGAAPAETDPVTVEDLIADRAERLSDYQDRAYAARYRASVRRVATAEQDRTPGREELTDAVARNLFKLMAYKDEYEVARLYADPEFAARLEREFEGDYRISVNLAPQMLNRRDARTGRARKWEIPGPVALPAFRVLARARRLRGTRFDPFGRTAHRQAERTRIERYESLLLELVDALGPDTHDLAVQLASLPDTIRGYDTIKDASAAVAEEKETQLLEQLRALSDRTTPARPGAPAGA
jgi:indolepyruvate ferredoxin oxidoreductase